MNAIQMHTQSKKDPKKLDFWSLVLPIAFDLVCGLLLIFLGKMALQVTTYVLSGLMIVFAAWLVITYFRSTPIEKITHSYLAGGMALAFTGVLLAFNPNYLESFLPFVWGLALLFGAFLKFQYAFDEKAVNIDKWWIMLIFSAFSLVIGILCLANPAFLGDKRELFIGITLVVEAVLDVVVWLLLSNALKKLNSSPLPAGESNIPEPVPASSPAEKEPVSDSPAADAGILTDQPEEKPENTPDT